MKKNVMFVKYALLCAISLGTASTVLTSCKDYDDDITNLQTQIDAVAKDLKDLKTLVGENPVKSVSYDEKTGVLTVVSATGTVTYQTHQTIPTYDIKLEGNVLYVNGDKKGEVTVKDASKVEVKDGFLYIDGVKTAITTPAEVEAGSKVEVKDNYLYIDGVKTAIQVPPTVVVENGILKINGVAQDLDLGLPSDAIAFVKNGAGDVTSVTVKLGDEEVSLQVKASLPLAGLAFIPQWIEEGVSIVNYCSVVDGSSNVLLASQPELSFRMNPTAVNTTNITWSFLNRTAKITSKAAGDNHDLISVVGTPSFNDGAVVLNTKADLTKVKGNPAMNVFDIFALEATYPKDPQKPAGEKTVVVSDYVQANIATLALRDLHIGDTVKLKATPTPTLASCDYETNLATIKGFSVPANHSVKYNAGTFNLKDYVFSSADLATYRYLLTDLNFRDFKYKFSKVDKYIGQDGVTDQQAFVSIDANGVVTILQGTAAINRTPLFKVELQNASGVTLTTAYIKFEIKDKDQGVAGEYVITIDGGNINYADLYGANPKTLAVDWVRMNQAYTDLSLSHDKFKNSYIVPTTADLVYSHPSTDAGIITASPNTPNIDTYALRLNILPTTKFGAHTWTVNYTPKNTEFYKTVTVKFNFTIVAPAKPVLSPIYAPGGVAETKGKMVGGTYKMQMTLKEAFTNYMADFTTGVVNKIPNATHQFAFNFVGGVADLTSNAIEDATNVPANAKVDPAGTYDLQEIMLTTPLTTARTYNVVFRSGYENGEEALTTFKVKFNNPFTISTILNPLSLETLANPTTLDLKKAFKVMLKDIVIYDGATVAGWTAAAGQYVNTATALSYGLQTTAVTGGRLTIDRTTGIVKWDNLGADLFQNITSEKATVTISADYAVATQKESILIKKNK